MASIPLVAELAPIRLDLLECTRTPGDPELAKDRNERNREGHELERAQNHSEPGPKNAVPLVLMTVTPVPPFR